MPMPRWGLTTPTWLVLQMKDERLFHGRLSLVGARCSQFGPREWSMKCLIKLCRSQVIDVLVSEILCVYTAETFGRSPSWPPCAYCLPRDGLYNLLLCKLYSTSCRHLALANR